MDIQIGIIGCGLIGEKHSECLATLGSKPTHFYDTNIAHAERLAHQYGGRVCTTPEEMFASEIDAVYICTYHDTHAPFAIAAASHGKHLFLEKPMALTAEGCYAIRDAVQTAGVRCMTGFKLRYYPLLEQARAYIPQPILLHGQIMDNRWPDDSWANDPIKGGGNVLSQGCHAIDLLTWLANSKPVQVIAEARNLHHPSLPITDTLSATISFENGAIANVLISDAGESAIVGKFSFEAFSGTASFHLGDRLKSLTMHSSDRTQEESRAEEEGFLEENREFLAALRENRAPRTTEIDGLRATMILLRALEASDTRTARSLTDIP